MRKYYCLGIDRFQYVQLWCWEVPEMIRFWVQWVWNLFGRRVRILSSIYTTNPNSPTRDDHFMEEKIAHILYHISVHRCGSNASRIHCSPILQPLGMSHRSLGSHKTISSLYRVTTERPTTNYSIYNGVDLHFYGRRSPRIFMAILTCSSFGLIYVNALRIPCIQ